ncbi:MAG: serine/threonine-protein kinase [Pirellulaceae bacterium]|nr:serine/threonine-protein kinase [Pirellulaceae bacterium]
MSETPESILATFKLAWASGARPDWRGFLPSAPELQDKVGPELLRADWQARLLRGDVVSIHDYNEAPQSWKIALPPEIPSGIASGGTVAESLETMPPKQFPNDLNAEGRNAGLHLDLSFLTIVDDGRSLGKIGHYIVHKVLGEGAFGIVFEATDTKLDRKVAVKVLKPSMAATSPPRKRFLREARAAAKIRHENVIQVYSVEEDPLPYLVMELINGCTLQQKLQADGPLEPKDVLCIGRQIAAGLAAAHKLGIIHRDIKPDNILLEEGSFERVKITDFGLARAADDASLTRSGVIAGTPMFMSPEQALGHYTDARTDLFSLGSLLYAAGCGRPPFRASSVHAVLKRVVDDKPRPMSEVLAEVPPWLERVVELLHEKAPDARIQSAREVADLLSRYESELQTQGEVIICGGATKTTNRPAEAPANHAPGLRTRRTAIVVAATALTGLAGFGAYKFGSWFAISSTGQNSGSTRNNQSNPQSAIADSASQSGQRSSTDDGLPDKVSESNLLQNSPVYWLPNHVGEVRAAAFGPNSDRIATGDDSGRLRIWKLVDAPEFEFEVKLHASKIWSLAFSPDGNLVASAGEDGTAVVYDCFNRKICFQSEKLGQLCKDVIFHSNDRIITTTGNAIDFWEVSSAKRWRAPLQSNSDDYHLIRTFASPGTIYSVMMAKDLSWQIVELDLATSNLQTIETNHSQIYDLCPIGSGRFLTAHFSGQVGEWSKQDSNNRQVSAVKDAVCWSVDRSAKRNLTVCGTDRGAYLLPEDSQMGTPLFGAQLSNWQVRRARFSSDEQWLALTGSPHAAIVRLNKPQ